MVLGPLLSRAIPTTVCFLLRSRSAPSRMAASIAAPAADYVVVGAGATGMAFVDTLLSHSPEAVSVLLLDKRDKPGGHWNDDYDFVRLHQPARNYGVETRPLEKETTHHELRASRAEILAYYQNVLEQWRSDGHQVEFVGGATYDFSQGAYSTGAGSMLSAVAAKKLVDARYTENDLPSLIPPKFAFGSALDVISPNELPGREAAQASGRKYCVIGAGKTGQDTMLYLRGVLNMPVDNLLWIMPTDPWITARDPPAPKKQITCMEFISSSIDAHEAAGAPSGATATADFLQRGFEAAEASGQIYRIDPAVTPTKFMDATLSQEEINALRECTPCIVRGRGRVSAIADDGSLTFGKGGPLSLPWASADGGAARTTFVHCTTGAFNFGASASEAPKPVFTSDRLITVQEIFQFPGFCTNGAVIGWIEAQGAMSLDEKNALCELPPAGASAPPAPPLGATAGTIGPLDGHHPLVRSLRNLRKWHAHPGMGEWLHGLRLFSLAMNELTFEEGKALVDRNVAGLGKAGVDVMGDF